MDGQFRRALRLLRCSSEYQRCISDDLVMFLLSDLAREMKELDIEPRGSVAFSG